MCHVYELKTLSKFAHFPLQRAADNAEAVKDIEQRLHSLSGLLTSPASEDDYVEKARRMELQRFVRVQTSIS